MFFCCPKTDQRETALAKAIENADKMMGQHMDTYSLEIANAIKANVKNNATTTIPNLLLGSNPKVTMDGMDTNNKMMTATLEFQCQNAGKENCVTCSGRPHTITGTGQDLGVTGVEGTFEIIDGKWTPGGNCYWIEKRMIRNNSSSAQQKQKQQEEEIAFVMLNMSETSEATVTVFGKKGTMNRTIRNIKLVVQQQQPQQPSSAEALALLCPSARTVVDMKKKKQQQQQQQGEATS